MATRFRLILSTPEDSVSAVLRLRAALKALQRRYGLRCVSAEELPQESATETAPMKDQTGTQA